MPLLRIAAIIKSMHLGVSISILMRVGSFRTSALLALLPVKSKLTRWLSVYNHVLKLDLATLQWNLVDNYGDIPGVRMGMCGGFNQFDIRHTNAYTRSHRLLVGW